MFLRFETQAPEVVSAALMRPLEVSRSGFVFAFYAFESVPFEVVRAALRTLLDVVSQCFRIFESRIMLPGYHAERMERSFD